MTKYLKRPAFLLFTIAAILAVCWKIFSVSELKQPVPLIASSQPIPEQIIAPAAVKPAAETLSSASKEMPLTRDTEKSFTKAQIHKRKPSQVIETPKRLTSSSILGGTQWKIWPAVKVVKSNEKSESNQISNLSIVPSEEFQPDINRFDIKEPIVIYNERLKRPGIITGTIKLETEDRVELEKELSNLRAHISQAFEPIQTYFIESSDQTFDLENLYLKLKQLPKVHNVELEILSKNYEKN